MAESNESIDLPVPVKKRPHWRVVIRPDTFNEERISTLKECWDLVSSCRVTLRGWDYPHIQRNVQKNGVDWISSWHDGRDHLEYWRFYQSGQFVHLFSFWEDINRQEAERRAKVGFLGMPENFTPSGYVDVIWTLLKITEIFEFATRITQKAEFTGFVSLTIQMIGIRNHILCVFDPARSWDGFFPCEEAEIGKEWRVEAKSLISNSAELARNATAWFYERFNWMDASNELLLNEQRNMLERRMR